MAQTTRGLAKAWTLGALLVACGGRAAPAPSDTSSPDAAGNATNGEATDSGTTDSAVNGGPSCWFSAVASAVPDETSSTGAVVAVLDVAGGTETQSFAAGFPYFGAGPSYAVIGGNAPTCACSSGIPLPVPGSNAGTITVDAADCGPALAVMSGPTGTDQPYAGTPAPAWEPGDVLGVAATGESSGIGAFLGALTTPVPPANVAPDIFGAHTKPVLIPRGEPLVLSWTPEGKAGETMMLRIAQTASQDSFVDCTCIGPDAPGTMTVPVSILSQYVPTASATGNTSAFFTRSIARAVPDGNASVDLVGLVELEGSVDFQ